MPTSSCTKCGRLISISTLPGGNPVALAEPEVWATSYGFCRKCRKYFCDRCCSVNQHCSQCGKTLEMGGPLHSYAEIKEPVITKQKQKSADKKMGVLKRIGRLFHSTSASQKQDAKPCPVSTQNIRGEQESFKSDNDQKEVPIICPNCSASHSLMEERIQGGEPETLKQAIEIMLLSEQTVRMLDKKGAVCMTTSGERLTFSSQLNRRHGWPCKSCGQIMSHSYLVNEGRKIGLYALQR